MKTFNRTCKSDRELTDGINTMKLEKGKQYLTSKTRNGKITVFGAFWVSDVPSKWFYKVEPFSKV